MENELGLFSADPAEAKAVREVGRGPQVRRAPICIDVRQAIVKYEEDCVRKVRGLVRRELTRKPWAASRLKKQV